MLAVGRICLPHRGWGYGGYYISKTVFIYIYISKLKNLFLPDFDVCFDIVLPAHLHEFPWLLHHANLHYDAHHRLPELLGSQLMPGRVVATLSLRGRRPTAISATAITAFFL